MTPRDRTIVVIVAVLVLVAGSWFFVISPKRDEASKLGDQVKAAQSSLATARSQLAAGQAAKSSFARDYTAIAQLGEAVPSDDNVPSLIYQLQSAASAANVDFRVLKLVAGSGAAPAPASGTTPGSGAKGAATQASATTLPPGAAIGPAGFPTLPFTFTFQGNFFHLANFFARVARFVVATDRHVSASGRLITLNSINLGPASRGFPQITATISASTYLVPASQGLMNGATPVGPASVAQAPSTTGGSVPAAAAVATPPLR